MNNILITFHIASIERMFHFRVGFVAVSRVARYVRMVWHRAVISKTVCIKCLIATIYRERAKEKRTQYQNDEAQLHDRKIFCLVFGLPYTRFIAFSSYRICRIISFVCWLATLLRMPHIILANIKSNHSSFDLLVKWNIEYSKHIHRHLHAILM